MGCGADGLEILDQYDSIANFVVDQFIGNFFDEQNAKAARAKARLRPVLGVTKGIFRRVTERGMRYGGD